MDLHSEPDEHTVALYHFDEGEGHEAHDACGDPDLTLRAERALWGSRPGSGATARFTRRADDANVFVGPTDNDKLHLRGCTREWTVEAWLRYTGPGGQDSGNTYANICGTDDEGFGLPTGKRGGWNITLHNIIVEDMGFRGTYPGKPRTVKDGLSPSARFIGFAPDNDTSGKDPGNGTSGILMPYVRSPGWTEADPPAIRDSEWHHVAWQFRYRDQTHFFFIDGRLVRKVQLPLPGQVQGRVINNARNVAVPFTVGGFIHSQNPPFHLEVGSFEGEIDELRISSIMRYPVAQQLAIVREELPTYGLGVPCSMQLSADADEGDVLWELVEGELPPGLILDGETGAITGSPSAVTDGSALRVRATDETGRVDEHTYTLNVPRGGVRTKSLPPAFAGMGYRGQLIAEHMAEPLQWTVIGELPGGLQLDRTSGGLTGTPPGAGKMAVRVKAVDTNGLSHEADLTLNVLSPSHQLIEPDEHTVVLYDWQGPDGKLIGDIMGDDELSLTWTNMGGDTRLPWPGRPGRYPQDNGHGEHGFVGPQHSDKLDLRTCTAEWTVEAWVRRGGPIQAHGVTVDEILHQHFDYGHICGTYDTTERGVWELYLSDHNSPDGSMAPGVHFLGSDPEQALMDLHPWKRPGGIVGDEADAAIGDIEWHHVAWQYCYDEDLHELFLDGRLIWRMESPDGRRLVNNRHHDAQFSVISRLGGYARHGILGPDGRVDVDSFNWLGWGNFFGQVGEIRISDVRRYH